MSLIRFLNSVRKHWWALMSCAAFTLLGMWVLYSNKSNNWTLQATFGLAAFCLFWACFLAWRDEERKVIELKTKIRDLEASRSTIPVQNIYLPPRPLPLEPPKHNIQCLGVTIDDCGVTICFQNVPIPETPIGDFRKARLSVEYKLESTGKEWVTIFPARWVVEDPENVSIGVVPVHAFLAAYYELEGHKWRALLSLENIPCNFSLKDRTKGIVLPAERFQIVVTLIGENNLSIHPIKGILALKDDGKASWTLAG